MRNNTPTLTRPQQRFTPADWLNPRRRYHCECLLDFIVRWRGGKLTFFSDQDSYRRELFEHYHMDAFAIRAACDDLYTLGVVDIRFSGGHETVIALAKSIDEMAGVR